MKTDFKQMKEEGNGDIIKKNRQEKLLISTNFIKDKI